MRSLTSLLQRNSFTIALASAAACGLADLSSAQVINADETGAGGGGVAQAQYTKSGSYFNRELGTPLRFSYHNEGYGTEEDVVSLGTMKVFNLDGATWFLDGQGTMSEGFGGGFNAGIGYRELVNMSNSEDPDRVLGASFWTDGQSTRADNFFTQLGVSLESLGESYDMRLNGYFPLERTKVGDPEIIDTNTVSFGGNGLFSGLERTTVDTAHSVVDAEAAKRLGNLDAWAILGAYHLGGGGADDAGFRAGFRGYALPDLAISVQVTDDDIYHTNVMAQLTWFVGRTHTGNAPIGAIVDRFREPVWRNDYIATTSTSTTVAATELTDAETNLAFCFFHVDPTATPGAGDGSFENPFATLEEAEMAQMENCTVYVHATDPAVQLMPTQTLTWLDGVNVWGEGRNQLGDLVQHQVDSVERGTVILPETSPGASGFNSPTIDANGTTDLFVLSDDNDINNFRINGGTNIIVADSSHPEVADEEEQEEMANAAANGINSPELRNLGIDGPAGTAINLTQITGTAVVENTVTIEDAGRGIFIDRGNSGMNINARITNSIGSSLVIQNRTGGTINYGGSIQDTNNMMVPATDHAIIIESNQDAILNFTQAINTGVDPVLGIDIDSGDFNALRITDNDDGTQINFTNNLAVTAAAMDTIFFTDSGTLTIQDTGDNSLIANTGAGDAFHYQDEDGDLPNSPNVADAVITIASNISNSGGGEVVEILDHNENDITFSGEVKDTASNGIVLTNNADGIIAFGGLVVTENSVNGVAANSSADDITYSFSNLDIDVTTGTGFRVTGDGTLIVNSAEGTNRVASASGSAIVLDGLTEGLTIGTGGANFDEVEVTNGAANIDGVVLRDLDGAQVRIGPATGTTTAGMISTSGTGTGIVIDDVANASINNVDITKDGTGQGMLVINQQEIDATTDSTIAVRGVEIDAIGAAARGLVVGTAADPNQDGNTASFDELVVNSVNGDAVVVEDNTGGTYIFNELTAATTGSGDAVFIDGNSDDTTVTFDGMTLSSNAVGSTGRGFVATNGGIIGATGDTSVATRTGAAVLLDDVAIDVAGAQFDTVNVTAGTSNGVVVRTTDGSGTVIIGSGSTAGAGGTITSAGDAILIDNADNVDVTRMTINNAGTANGLVIQNQDGGTVDVIGLTTTTVDGSGVTIQNNTNGDVNFVANTDVNVTGAGTGILVRMNTGGTNDFTGTSTDVDVTGTGAGVNLATNTGATNNFSGLTVSTTSGTGFAATGGGTITATGTNRVNTTDGVAVNLNAVTIGTDGFSLASVDVTSGDTNAITLTNTTGGQFRVGAATATGTDGNGGTLVTTGDAIVLNGATNAVFNDIIVDATTGIAADINHSSSANTIITFDNLSRPAGVDPTGGNGIALEDSGAGELHFILRNSGIDTENTGDVGFAFDTTGSTNEVNVSLINNTINAANASAVAATIDDGSGDIQFLMRDNTVANSSGANPTANFVVTASRTLNATIGSQNTDLPFDSNSFTNANAGSGTAFAMSLNNGSGTINLDLRDNAAAGVTQDFILTQTAGTFGVVDLPGTTTTDSNNSGTVNTAGTFMTIMPPIKQPD